MVGTVFKKIVIVIGMILSLLFGFAFHLAGGSLVIKEVLKHQPKENLDFSFSSCDEENKYRKDQVLSAIRTDNKIVIKAGVAPNCGTIWMLGDYEIHQNKLILKYRPILGSFLACKCSHEVEYVIDEFPLNRYEIEIKDQEELYNDISWFYDLIY
ncbi:hypothetical protein NBRC116188_28140 [Oceaniserpentilla sp. 4NH20-0058]